jgi:hypothetical protein
VPLLKDRLRLLLHARKHIEIERILGKGEARLQEKESHSLSPLSGNNTFPLLFSSLLCFNHQPAFLCLIPLRVLRANACFLLSWVLDISDPGKNDDLFSDVSGIIFELITVLFCKRLVFG